MPYKRQERYRWLLAGGAFFTCAGIILFQELASTQYYWGVFIGLIIALPLVYYWDQEYAQLLRNNQLSKRTEVGLGTSIMIGLLVVFGAPIFAQSFGDAKPLIAGLVSSWLSIFCFGCAISVYRHK